MSLPGLSLASNATSGASFRDLFGGDFIVGGQKAQPPWLWLALAGVALAAAVVYFLRK